jgi:hypothetical protein
VKLASLDGVKSVVIDASLEQTDEMLFEFLMDFARDNQLQTDRLDQFPVEQSA